MLVTCFKVDLWSGHKILWRRIEVGVNLQAFRHSIRVSSNSLGTEEWPCWQLNASIFFIPYLYYNVIQTISALGVYWSNLHSFQRFTDDCLLDGWYVRSCKDSHVYDENMLFRNDLVSQSLCKFSGHQTYRVFDSSTGIVLFYIHSHSLDSSTSGLLLQCYSKDWLNCISTEIRATACFLLPPTIVSLLSPIIHWELFYEVLAYWLEITRRNPPVSGVNLTPFYL